MTASTLSVPGAPAPNALQTTFLALLPKLQRQAEICFHRIACPAQQADKIAETVAPLAWKWYVRLVEMGKDVTQFSSVFVDLVTKAVKCGRLLNGQDKAREVLSPVAQRRHGFRVEGLQASLAARVENLFGRVDGQRQLDQWEERLHDNTQTPVPDQVQFRIDFRAWLKQLTVRDRRILRAMARNERNQDLSRRFRVSSARISQLRRQFKEGWQRFCGEEGGVTIQAMAYLVMGSSGADKRRRFSRG